LRSLANGRSIVEIAVILEVKTDGIERCIHILLVKFGADTVKNVLRASLFGHSSPNFRGKRRVFS